MPAMWVEEPAPAVPTLTFSWFAFTQATNSLRSFASTPGLETTIIGLPPIMPTGSRSFSRS